MSQDFVQNDTLGPCAISNLSFCNSKTSISAPFYRLAKLTQETTPVDFTLNTNAGPEINTGIVFEISASGMQSLPAGDWTVRLNRTGFNPAFGRHMIVKTIDVCRYDQNCMNAQSIGGIAPNTNLTGPAFVHTWTIACSTIAFVQTDKFLIAFAIQSSASGSTGIFAKADQIMNTPFIPTPPPVANAPFRSLMGVGI